jgi:hypothetical protein
MRAKTPHVGHALNAHEVDIQVGCKYGSPDCAPGKPMNAPSAEIGASISDIETSALALDLDAFDDNAA